MANDVNIVDHVSATLDAAISGRAAALHLHGPRGAGKSWWLDEAARQATQRDMTVLRVRGSDEDRELPFAALSMLLSPFRDRLADDAWSSLRSVVAFDHRQVDSFEVKLASFQLFCAMAAQRRLCFVIDDVHLLDAASTEVLAFTVRRADADAIACISAGLHDRAATATTVVRLEPLSTAAVTTLLVARGVADNAARRCADVADGNPGIAVAVAEGLTGAQRAGTAPISVLPRPSGALVDDLQMRLRAHGESVCRALAVAAAEHGGSTDAVRGALVSLGEPPDGFELVESLGLIDIVGAHFTFTDPWIRAVAYHLVAPASRRAAHSVLAAWFDAPEQAAERAWHLAAGAVGPSDAVAGALRLVAADAARRGALESAALTAERAAEFATSASGQQQLWLIALEWWMRAAHADGVRRILRLLDPLDLNGACARAEAMEFLDGRRVEVRFEQPAPIPTREPLAHSWIAHRDRRLALEDAVDRGDHRTVLQTLDAAQSHVESSATDLVARSIALRHAGRLRDARDAVIKASAMFDGSDAYPTWLALLVGIDLDILQARSDDATASLNAVWSRLPAGLHEWRNVLASRNRLQLSNLGSPTDEPEAFTALGAGALREIRELIRDGALNADAAALVRAIELAEHNTMPVEAGESRLWLAALQAGDERRRTLSLSGATLQRCGIRAWDAWLHRYTDDTGQVALHRRSDPALESLSQAEFRVADAVAGGLTNRQVAASLLISVKTVDFHLQQMYRKLGIRSRTELAVRMTNFDSTVRGDRR